MGRSLSSLAGEAPCLLDDHIFLGGHNLSFPQPQHELTGVAAVLPGRTLYGKHIPARRRTRSPS